MLKKSNKVLFSMSLVNLYIFLNILTERERERQRNRETERERENEKEKPA